ncbi:MAG: recombinase zinc beta ribbon domain-containing protein [Elusimicrobia bacterium]|nr:recombinase zinc beta ribbon domain-containing protein [Elusimicrobiota bacterium]
MKPKDEWIVSAEAHEAIVPKELFLSVQAKLKSRPFGHGAANRRKNWLLSGLVVCAECGHRFQGLTKKGKGRTAEYYTCGGYVTKGSQVCRSIHVPREALELFVVETIRKRITDPGWMKDLQERIGQVVEAELRDKPGLSLEAMKESLVRNQKHIDNLLDAIKSGLLSASLRQELDRLEAVRRQLMEEKETVQKRRSVNVAVDVILREMKQLLGEFEAVILNGTNDQRKAFLRAFLCETRITHANGQPQATHYFFKVPRPQKEVTEGKHPNLALAFGNTHLTKMVAGAGFEPATSRL